MMIRSATALRNDYDGMVKLSTEKQEPIYLTRNGYGDMVLMSMKAYEEKLMMLELYEKLAIAEEEVKNGKTKDGVAALQKLREKYHV